MSIQSNGTVLLTGNSFIELQLATQASTASGRLWMHATVPLIYTLVWTCLFEQTYAFNQYLFIKIIPMNQSFCYSSCFVIYI